MSCIHNWGRSVLNKIPPLSEQFTGLTGLDLQDIDTEVYRPTKTDPYGRIVERGLKAIAIITLLGGAGGPLWGAWHLAVEPIRSGVQYGFFQTEPIFSPTSGSYYHRIPSFELFLPLMLLAFAIALIRTAIQVMRAKTR